MESYSIGLMYQFESKWYSKTWLESNISDARRDAERVLSKKIPGIKLTTHAVTPGSGSRPTLKETISEHLEKLDLVIFEFSDNNPNVMIEFGIRLRSQKPYLIIKSEDADTLLPSNVSNEFCVMYSTGNDFFSGQLAERIIKIAERAYVRVEQSLDGGETDHGPVSYKKKPWPFAEKLFEVFVDYEETKNLRKDFYDNVRRRYINEKFRYTGINEATAWNNLCSELQYRPYWDSVDLLQKRLPEVLTNVYSDKVTQVDFVCLGIGSGQKEKIILDAILDKQEDLNFYLVDASIEMLGLSLHYYVTHLKDYEGRISAIGLLADLTMGLSTKPKVFPEKRPSLFALLGNTIGNYSEQPLLRSIRGMMEKDDCIMIDAQLLPKDVPEDEIENEIRKSYDNTLFKRFVMAPLLRVGVSENSGRVDVNIPHSHPEGLHGRAFTARYDWVFSKDVSGQCGDSEVNFYSESRVGLGFSVKYDIDFLCSLITNCGFKVLKTFLWHKNYYGLVLAQRT
jgi:uncharacterized SAM-dependent methyltransferase